VVLPLLRAAAARDGYRFVVDVVAGQVIAGKYELERLLGKGNMGEVWLARHTSLEGAYAVKLIDVKAVPDAAGRFQMEAHIAAKLSKKTRHIVSVTDHGEDGDLAYLVMPALEGESLEERIQRAAPLPVGEVSMIVVQASRGLTHAHAAGFIHRDLKPANIFLTKDEEGRLVVKLLDFGIARATSPVPVKNPFTTGKDVTVGTPAYMSPEQTRALETLDHRCDVWALAVVAYEALAREMPFEGETLQDLVISIGIGRMTPLRERRRDLAGVVDTFFEKSFAADIGDRYASAEESANAFARAAGASNPSWPSIVPPPPARARAEEITAPPPPLAAVRRPRVWIGIAALLLAGLVGASVRLLAARASQPAAPATVSIASTTSPVSTASTHDAGNAPLPAAATTVIARPSAVPAASPLPPRVTPRPPEAPPPPVSAQPHASSVPPAPPPASVPPPVPAPPASVDPSTVF
jgi:eukaryotic-like serine/threonine-protein kinase